MRRIQKQNIRQQLTIPGTIATPRNDNISKLDNEAKRNRKTKSQPKIKNSIKFDVAAKIRSMLKVIVEIYA